MKVWDGVRTIVHTGGSEVNLALKGRGYMCSDECIVLAEMTMVVIFAIKVFLLFSSDIYCLINPMKMNKKRKFSSYKDIKNIVFFEITTGITANVILLLFHILMFLLKHRPKPLDLTIAQLALVHWMLLVTMGFIATDTFEFEGWGNDFMCKSVIYVNRLMRALSICTTCLLSVLQAIILSPRNSFLAKFKHKSSHYYPCCLVFLWVLNMLLNIRFLISIGATPNGTSHSLNFVTESCSQWPISYFFRYIFLSLVNIQDISFVGLMALSSGYMVNLLCRHKRQFQHLHHSNLSPKAYPGERATQTILVLTGFFMLMYCLDCVIFSSLVVLWNNDPIYHCVQMLVGNAYATMCPFVLMSTEKRMMEWLISMRKRQ
ncbi:vomeronasal type-1 receptor 90-like [Octodon degus]|uniref:Vomeronasal type-1 receptor n=1 Tax=Octodon degus TaxID=10160 RepID=A0A6P3FWP9_OCTDE|nr:vomeronasal type-1 receptor 90-like [Octodon degus]